MYRGAGRGMGPPPFGGQYYPPPNFNRGPPGGFPPRLPPSHFRGAPPGGLLPPGVGGPSFAGPPPPVAPVMRHVPPQPMRPLVSDAVAKKYGIRTLDLPVFNDSKYPGLPTLAPDFLLSMSQSVATRVLEELERQLELVSSTSSLPPLIREFLNNELGKQSSICRARLAKLESEAKKEQEKRDKARKGSGLGNKFANDGSFMEQLMQKVQAAAAAPEAGSGGSDTAAGASVVSGGETAEISMDQSEEQAASGGGGGAQPGSDGAESTGGTDASRTSQGGALAAEDKPSSAGASSAASAQGAGAVTEEVVMEIDGKTGGRSGMSMAMPQFTLGRKRLGAGAKGGLTAKRKLDVFAAPDADEQDDAAIRLLQERIALDVAKKAAAALAASQGHRVPAPSVSDPEPSVAPAAASAGFLSAPAAGQAAPSAPVVSAAARAGVRRPNRFADAGETSVPEVAGPQKDVIDKFAAFVAENGEDVEGLAREKGHDDPQFRFLFQISSKEHLYYKWKLRQLLKEQE